MCIRRYVCRFLDFVPGKCNVIICVNVCIRYTCVYMCIVMHIQIPRLDG